MGTLSTGALPLLALPCDGVMHGTVVAVLFLHVLRRAPT